MFQFASQILLGIVLSFDRGTLLDHHTHREAEGRTSTIQISSIPRGATIRKTPSSNIDLLHLSYLHLS